ncbi:MAG: hypothetical protein ACREQ2_15735 [Candidatus Binatia bacterium]
MMVKRRRVNWYGEMAQAYREAITRVVRQRQGSAANLYLLDGLTMVNDPLFSTTLACAASPKASPPRSSLC